MREKLGQFFMALRERSGLLKLLFFCCLALLVVLNFFVLPHHPHVNEEHYPGFWAIFAFVGASVMIFLIKRIIANLIGVSEDFYGD